MAEPLPQPDAVCLASLLSLPPEVGEIVWQALWRGLDRCSLMGVSTATQALFSPAVKRLTYQPKPDTHQNPSSGLHKDVQPECLRIHGAAGRGEQQQQQHQEPVHARHLSALSSIPHWSRLQRLELDNVNLVAGSLEPLPRLSTLQHLQLAGCALHVSNLPCIRASKHLQRLYLIDVQLIHDIQTPDESALPVVAGPPSLDLVIWEVTPTDAVRRLAPMYSLPCWLGPRLRSIMYTCSRGGTEGPVQQVLEASLGGHLAGLRRLGVTNNQARGWVDSEQLLRALPTTCPRLEYLKLDNVLLERVRLLPTFMAMPALEHLELFAVNYRTWAAPPTPLPVAWPAGKEPMCLKLQMLEASSIPGLPFQHISKISCSNLHMQAEPDSTVASETQKLRGLLELLQSKGAVLQVGRITGSRSNGEWAAAGLSALSGPAGCHIVPCNPRGCMVANMLLDAPDITAIASTWGSQLTSLTLRCNLTPAAWAAITASKLPSPHIPLWP